MAKRPPAQLEQQLNHAFESFRDALQSVLEEEAQSSVQRALERMATQDGLFSVSDAQVQVVVSGLTVEATASGGGSPTSSRTSRRRASAKRPPAPSRRRSTGRRGARGGVREALLASFETPEMELTIEDLTRHLSERGVKSTTNNLHQQLRRLVQSGELMRAGRGIYKRAS